MGDRQKVSWKRISAEGFTIIASILLAFTIDAWWQERLERRNESEQLSRLHAEFVSNVERIGDYLVRVAGSQHATEEVVSLVREGGDIGLASVDVPIVLLQRVLDAPTFEPDTPVFDSLIRSGQQVLLKDRSVINSLADWDRSFQNYIELAVRTRQTMDAHLVPALARRGGLTETLMTKPLGDTLHELDVDPKDTVRIDIDDELGSYLAERYRNGLASWNTLGRAQSVAELVVDAIEHAQSQ